MEFLSLDEARAKAQEIREALNQILATKTLVGRPRAKQWRFLAACMERLLSPESLSEFDQLSPVQAAQFKFEVEDRLRRFYPRDGRPLEIALCLLHKSELASYSPDIGETYPDLAGYCLMVRDLSSDVQSAPNPADLRSFLERVVTEAIDAEFRAYAALPKVVPDTLIPWFSPQGPAYKAVVSILTRHSKRGWVISNELNPSTKRLLSIKVRKVSSNEATVGTMEYWFLRWWDVHQQSYTYPYRETNRQTYILRKEPDGWRVWDNLRPAPRTSAPYRRIRRQAGK